MEDKDRMDVAEDPRGEKRSREVEDKTDPAAPIDPVKGSPLLSCHISQDINSKNDTDGAERPTKKARRNSTPRTLQHDVGLLQFYDLIRPPSNSPSMKQPPGFEIIELFPYQLRAVSWMMGRERVFSQDVRGGILADEMGLGKTIEVIALVVSNPRDHVVNKNDRDLQDHIRQSSSIPLPAPGNPNVFVEEHLFPSKSTLIVAPSILIDQWKSEIEKHVSTLSLYIYNGVKTLSEALKELSEARNIFAAYDIVLTSYDVFANEVHFAQNHERNVRYSHKKFLSPLVRVNWWRICMDEAQEVKTSTTQTARMAALVPAINRWCVSGTIIKNSFEDLKGALVFLKCESKWNLKTDKLLEFFKAVSWRHSKKDLESEISIPPPKETSSDVILSNFENMCLKRMREVISSREDLEAVHSRNVFSKFNSAPYAVLTAEVFEKEIKTFSTCNRESALALFWADAISSLQESQLDLMRELNDLAAAKRKDGQIAEALKLFRNVTHLGQYHEDSEIFRRFGFIEGVNSASIVPESIGFQNALYHAACNFKALWDEQSASFKSSIQDLRLEDREEIESIIVSIREKVLSPSRLNVEKRFAKWKNDSLEVDNLESNRLSSPHGTWWLRMLRYLQKYYESEFVENLRNGVQQGYSTKFVGWSQHILRVNNLRDINDLANRLLKNLKILFEARHRARGLLSEKISAEKDSLEAERSVMETTADALEDFENCLAERKIIKDGQGEGFQTERIATVLSKTERILLYVERMAIIEYNRWLPIANKDEASQATVSPRISALSLITFEAEAFFRELEVMKLEVINGGHYLDAQKKLLATSADLEQHVEPQIGVDAENAAAKAAEIERKIKEAEQVILAKRDFVIKLLQEKNRVVAPLKRFGTKPYFVFQHITRHLRTDKEGKIIVFSAFPEPLVQLSTLLEDANINYSSGKAIQGMKNSGRLSNRIDKFRSDPTVRVLLLNALKQSTGLTLTQATMVLLMDPIDDASELQAIGRAYRIGQKKTTYIYRYNVIEGIEEAEVKEEGALDEALGDEEEKPRAPEGDPMEL